MLKLWVLGLCIVGAAISVDDVRASVAACGEFQERGSPHSSSMTTELFHSMCYEWSAAIEVQISVLQQQQDDVVAHGLIDHANG